MYALIYEIKLIFLWGFMEKDFVDGKYKGFSLDGKTRHGLGTMKYSNGDEYYGLFAYNKREGKGKMKYANGNFYEGEWKNDVKHGFGTMKYANGNVYIGSWQNNKRHGKGTLRYKNGVIVEGAFENGELKSVIKRTEPEKKVQPTKKPQQKKQITKKPQQAPKKRIVKSYIEQQREKELERIEIESMEEFKKGVEAANKHKFEKAIEFFKSAKRMTNNCNLSNKCDENIKEAKKCIEILQEKERCENLQYCCDMAVVRFNGGDRSSALAFINEALSYCNEDEYEIRKQLEDMKYDCL